MDILMCRKHVPTNACWKHAPTKVQESFLQNVSVVQI